MLNRMDELRLENKALKEGQKVMTEVFMEKCTEVEELKDELSSLKDTCLAAILAGDWVVDGACDPDLTREPDMLADMESI